MKRARGLIEALGFLMHELDERNDREAMAEIRRRAFFRVRNSDHLRSGRIPRRELARIEQETEDVAGRAMVRYCELMARGEERTEAIRRAVNWAARDWSLARRLDALQTEAARENSRRSYTDDVLSILDLDE